MLTQETRNKKQETRKQLLFYKLYNYYTHKINKEINLNSC